MIDPEKLAYALYLEDAYTYGLAKPVDQHQIPKLDMSTYLGKAKRIIGSLK